MRFPRLPHSPLLILSLLLAASASAQLKFESIHQEASAKPEDTELMIKFPFSNPTGSPIRVASLESTCGCIKGSTDKRVYGPGEAGVVQALFSLGSFVGTHQKVVYLDTEKPDEQRYKLTVTVNIPEVVVIEPKLTKWTIGEEAAAKQIDVKFVGAEPMKITGLQSTRPQFEFSSETIEEGRHYRITLKPTTTAEPIMGALKISTDSKTPKYQGQFAFFNVARERRRPATVAAEQGATPATASE